MKMRDPPIYRIRRAHHYRTKDDWCLYPMYDFAHCLSDSIEGITHSICTLEFENNRELYDWFLDELAVDCHPQQIEFARLNLTYTVMSKRKLLRLVKDQVVSGWDDPRMPTIAGLRRRGYTPESIRNFCARVGITRSDGIVEVEQLEYSVREHLNREAPRVLCVLRPLRVVIENYPRARARSSMRRTIPKTSGGRARDRFRSRKVLYVDRDDFAEEPPEGFFRLAPGREGAASLCLRRPLRARRKGCGWKSGFDAPTIRNARRKTPRWAEGQRHDPLGVGGACAEVEVRLYDRLFSCERPDDVAEGEDFRQYLNPRSIEVLPDARIEPSMQAPISAARYQFERVGFFSVDAIDSRPNRPVFNRIVALRDSWARQAQPEDRSRTTERAPPTPRRDEVEAKRTKAPRPAENAPEVEERIPPLCRRSPVVSSPTRARSRSATHARTCSGNDRAWSEREAGVELDRERRPCARRRTRRRDASIEWKRSRGAPWTRRSSNDLGDGSEGDLGSRDPRRGQSTCAPRA